MRYLFLFLIVLSFLSCEQTTVNSDSSIEVDRVWQYLKTYSIYTDKLLEREDAQKMGSPYVLAKSVWDTIRYLDSDYVFHFTYYDREWENVWDNYFPVDSIPRNLTTVDTTVYAAKVTDSILYLHIPQFTPLSYSEVLDESNIASQCNNLILDLRWNPGGYVDICTLIVNLFLPNNTHYMNTIYRSSNVNLNSEAKVDTTAWYSSVRDTDFWRDKKIAILMNKHSASASEILAEAFRNDSIDCRMIGSRTFGKGIGQIHVAFRATSGGGMSITTLKFLGIDNTTYHNIGIEPHDYVDGDSTITDDNQLIAAALYLDPTFNVNSYTNEISTISNAIQRRHDFTKIRSGNYEIRNFRPMAIVDEIFVD